MLKRVASICLCLAAGGAGAGIAFAGGRLETIDITGHAPSGAEGQLQARVIGTKWDVRCFPVRYKVNVGSGVMSGGVLMVPNPLGPPEVSMADAMTTLQEALDAWNRIPTSYIDMRITGTVDKPGTPGFDFINEATFRTESDYGFLADSQLINLIEDTTLCNYGTNYYHRNMATPGSRVHYHGLSAHWTLAMVINAVTGEDFRTFITREVITRLGLQNELFVGVSAAEAARLSDMHEPLPVGQGQRLDPNHNSPAWRRAGIPDLASRSRGRLRLHGHARRAHVRCMATSSRAPQNAISCSSTRPTPAGTWRST